MAEVQTSPVTAKRCEDIDDVAATPGAFEYYRAGDRYPAGIIYNCPCGCGHQGTLHFKPDPSPSWTWDGNLDAPTLAPSVHHVGHWHGYLTAGVWRSA